MIESQVLNIFPSLRRKPKPGFLHLDSGCSLSRAQPQGRNDGKCFLLGCLLFLLTACGTTPDGGPPPGTLDPDDIENAVVRDLPRSEYGNPDSYTVFGETYYVLDSAVGYSARGMASWYGNKFHGRRTSSGEPYDMYAMTAAHKTLPLPTFVRVTNLDNGKSAIVKVNDRGPFSDGRIIDLSYAAAAKIGLVATGTARVEVVALTPGQTIEPPDPAPQTNRPAGLQTWVQVGAFKETSNAYQLLGELLAAGFSTAQVKEPAGGSGFFRVQLGPFDNAAQAETVNRRLAARLNMKNTLIVTE